MREKLFNLSNKLDPLTFKILKIITRVTESLDMRFFVIGATARDIILHNVHRIPIYRQTNDIDFGVNIEIREDFEKLIHELERFNFEPTNVPHKFNYKGIPNIDIIPFGKIGGEKQKIIWETDKGKSSTELNILGFDEAFNKAEEIIIQDEPEIKIKFVSMEEE